MSDEEDFNLNLVIKEEPESDEEITMNLGELLPVSTASKVKQEPATSEDESLMFDVYGEDEKSKENSPLSIDDTLDASVENGDEETEQNGQSNGVVPEGFRGFAPPKSPDSMPLSFRRKRKKFIRHVLNDDEMKAFLSMWKKYLPELENSVRTTDIYEELSKELYNFHGIRASVKDLRRRVAYFKQKYRLEKRIFEQNGSSDWCHFKLLDGFFTRNDMDEPPLLNKKKSAQNGLTATLNMRRLAQKRPAEDIPPTKRLRSKSVHQTTSTSTSPTQSPSKDGPSILTRGLRPIKVVQAVPVANQKQLKVVRTVVPLEDINPKEPEVVKPVPQKPYESSRERRMDKILEFLQVESKIMQGFVKDTQAADKEMLLLLKRIVDKK